MFTTRMSPKMSEKPLATMNSRPAKRQAVHAPWRRTRAESSIADPVFVVCQLPPPNSSGGFAMTTT